MHPVLIFMVCLVYMLEIFDVILHIFTVMVIEFLEIFIGQWAPVRRRVYDYENCTGECKNPEMIHKDYLTATQTVSGPGKRWL